MLTTFNRLTGKKEKIKIPKVKSIFNYNKKTKQKTKEKEPCMEAYLYSTIRMVDPELLEGLKKQYRFCRDEYVKRRFQFDFCYPELKLAIEVDGGQWQSGGGRHMTDDDYHKLNIAVAHGYYVLRFKTSMVSGDGVGCVMRIREVYDNLCKK
jgi:very-short-patch-repair endonuclease